MSHPNTLHDLLTGSRWPIGLDELEHECLHLPKSHWSLPQTRAELERELALLKAARLAVETDRGWLGVERGAVEPQRSFAWA